MNAPQWFSIVTALSASLIAPPLALGQTTQVEIDHVFVFVSPGAAAEADSLRALGFIVAPEVSRHTGVGTASRSVLFENAYLELIWMDSSVSRSGDQSENDMERAANWRATGVSPFGLGLRRLRNEGNAGVPTTSYGVPATSYTWEWMQPGSSMDVLKQASEPDAFMAFVIPEYMALPSWIGDVKQNGPELLRHPNGSRRLTGVEIHGPARHHALAARSLRIPGLRLIDASEPLLVLEFDGGARGTTLDLRPLLPLAIRR